MSVFAMIKLTGVTYAFKNIENLGNNNPDDKVETIHKINIQKLAPSLNTIAINSVRLAIKRFISINFKNNAVFNGIF